MWWVLWNLGTRLATLGGLGSGQGEECLSLEGVQIGEGEGLCSRDGSKNFDFQCSRSEREKGQIVLVDHPPDSPRRLNPALHPTWVGIREGTLWCFGWISLEDCYRKQLRVTHDRNRRGVEYRRSSIWLLGCVVE